MNTSKVHNAEFQVVPSCPEIEQVPSLAQDEVDDPGHGSPRQWVRYLTTATLLLSIVSLGGLLFLVGSTQPQGASPAVNTILIGGGVLSLLGLLFMLPRTLRQFAADAKSERHDLILKRFVQKNPEAMFVKNLDSSFAVVNEKFIEIVSEPNDSMRTISDHQDLPDVVANRIHQQDLQVIECEEPMEFHSKYKREDTDLHVKTVRFPIYDDRHELIAIGGITSDVTDQVHSRHALMENEKLLRTFIESAPDAVLICSDEGDVSLVNEAAEAIFGFDRSQMLGMNLVELIRGVSAEDFVQAMRVARTEGHNMVAEIRQGSGVGCNKDDFPVEFSLAPVTAAGGSLVICALRDVSEKVAMETQLRHSQKMEAIGKLTGGMAHDFNNLLGIMIGNLALAKRKLDAQDPLLKRLDTALNAAERGAELTKRMLAVAQRQPLQPKPMCLNDVVSELAKMLPQTLGTDIEIELNLSDDLPPVEVDESAAESMLLNLAINARDAMPQGGTFSISSSAVSSGEIEQVLPDATVPEEKYIRVTVKDTGTGMSSEALNRAFEPFYTTKEKGKGTGLGLAMIYGFVKQSRGYIDIDSAEGEGTSVHIFLPACAEKLVKQRKRPSKIDVPYLASRSHTVLVVDDEVGLLEIARAYLEDLGCKVFTAESGSEALEIISNHDEVELLFTDVVMPKMNGVALVENVRKMKPDISVLYASGFPSGRIQEKSGTQLDAPLVHKPYSRDSLAEIVMETLLQREESAKESH